MSLKARAAAGLVNRCRAARRDWYLTRHAARHIRDARPYQADAQVPPLQTPRVARRDKTVLASTNDL